MDEAKLLQRKVFLHKQAIVLIGGEIVERTKALLKHSIIWLHCRGLLGFKATGTLFRLFRLRSS